MSKTQQKVRKSPKDNKILRIGIDIDNSIADSYKNYIDKINILYGFSLKLGDIEEFEFIERKEYLGKQESDEFYVKYLHDEKFQMGIEPYQQSQKVIGEWFRKGYSIHYITARPHTTRMITKKWLAKHGFWNDKLSTLDLIRNSEYLLAGPYKKDVAERIGIDLMIEDSVEVAYAINNIPVLLLDWPWNRGKMPDNVIRVNDWDGIEKYVEETIESGIMNHES